MQIKISCLWVERLSDPFVHREGRAVGVVVVLLLEVLDHGLDFHGAHDKVVKCNGLVGGTVTVDKGVEDVIVQVIPGRGQRLTELIGVEFVGAVVVVEFEDGLWIECDSLLDIKH